MLPIKINPVCPAPEIELVEILDEAGKPLCLLSPETLADQNLPFLNVQVLACSKSKVLFHKTSDNNYEFTVYGPVLHGEITEQTAARLMRSALGIPGIVQKKGFLASSLNSIGAGTAIFTANLSTPMLCALENENFWAIEPHEIPVLAKNNLFAPEIIKMLVLMDLYKPDAANNTGV